MELYLPDDALFCVLRALNDCFSADTEWRTSARSHVLISCRSVSRQWMRVAVRALDVLRVPIVFRDLCTLVARDPASSVFPSIRRAYGKWPNLYRIGPGYSYLQCRDSIKAEIFLDFMRGAELSALRSLDISVIDLGRWCGNAEIAVFVSLFTGSAMPLLQGLFVERRWLLGQERDDAACAEPHRRRVHCRNDFAFVSANFRGRMRALAAAPCNQSRKNSSASCCSLWAP